MKKSMKKMISLLLSAITIITALSCISFGASAAELGNVKEQSNVLLKNVKTGEYMNFDYGTLKNGTIVRCWPKDGSTEQIWRIQHISGNIYRLLTQKSASYCFDIYRANAALRAGQTCDIWASGKDTTAQNIILYKCSNGNYIIRMNANSNLAVTSAGSKSQLKLASFSASNTAQQWIFTDKNGNRINVDNTSAGTTTSTTAATTTAAFVKPLKSSYSTNITTQSWGTSGHLGVDLGTSGNRASTVHSIYPGTVYKIIKNDSGWGNMVIVQHTINGKTFYSGYAHMANNSIVVSVGQSLSAGQKLGTMGSTGNSSGAHVHLVIFSGSVTKNTIPAGYTSSKISGDTFTIGKIKYYNPLKVISSNGSII